MEEEEQPRPQEGDIEEERFAGGRIADVLDQLLRDRKLLVGMAQRMGQQTPQPRAEGMRLKSQMYDGNGDVELFLQQFLDVATISGWTEQQGLLKLREVLTGRAQDCARGTTQAEVVEALRLRFGVTSGDARRRLAGLKRDPCHTLHEHASEVRRLTRLAGEGANDGLLEAAACEHFQLSLGNLGLQRHLLTFRALTLENNIRAAEEYLRLAPVRNERVQVIQSEDEEDVEKPKDSVAVASDPQQGLLETLKRLEERLGRLETSS